MTATYGRSRSIREDCTACMICLEEFKKRDKILTLPCDWHYFHAKCIRPWLVKNQQCPVCRKVVSLEEMKA